MVDESHSSARRFILDKSIGLVNKTSRKAPSVLFTILIFLLIGFSITLGCLSHVSERELAVILVHGKRYTMLRPKMCVRAVCIYKKNTYYLFYFFPSDWFLIGIFSVYMPCKEVPAIWSASNPLMGVLIIHIPGDAPNRPARIPKFLFSWREYSIGIIIA